MFKHLKTILAAALCALVLSACSDAEQTFHQLAFEQPSNLVKELYADQRTDSVVFVSYDPWTATASEEWLVLSPTSGTTPGRRGRAQHRAPEFPHQRHRPFAHGNYQRLFIL
ncbi:MAG: hypothetical protein SPG28_01380 [Alloprevotella sp.]|nr:hypothetical protein [Alloprevotella sp.]